MKTETSTISFKIKFALSLTIGSLFLFTCNKDQGDDQGGVKSIDAIESGNISKRHSSDVICGQVVAGDDTNTTEGLKKIIYRSLPAVLTMSFPGGKLFDVTKSFEFKPDTSACTDALANSLKSVITDERERDAAVKDLTAKSSGLSACAVLVDSGYQAPLNKIPKVWLKGDNDVVKQNMHAMVYYALYEYWNDIIFKGALKNGPDANLQGTVDKLDAARNAIAQAAFDKLNATEEGRKSLGNLVTYFRVADIEALRTNNSAKTFFAVEAIDSHRCHPKTQERMRELKYDAVIKAIETSPLAELFGNPWFK